MLAAVESSKRLIRVVNAPCKRYGAGRVTLVVSSFKRHLDGSCHAVQFSILSMNGR
jgi:hypothetical protein